MEKNKNLPIPWREAFRYSIKKYTEAGFLLRCCRTKENISQKKLAEKMNLSPKYVSDLENGKIPISKDMATKLAKVLRADKRFFYNNEKTMDDFDKTTIESIIKCLKDKKYQLADTIVQFYILIRERHVLD